MKIRTFLKNLWIWVDYRLILPFLAFLPQKVGRYLASLRGGLYFYLQRDWRSFVFGDLQLFSRTYNSYKEIFPNFTHKELLHLVQQRYMYQSIEEFESALLIQKKYHQIDVEYIGLEEVMRFIEKNPHAVFMTIHFGSIIGLTFLNVLNIPVLHMSSNVTKQKIVPPSITHLYLKKYVEASKRLNGGEVMDAEGNSKKFFTFLKKRGSLCSVGDLPPSSPSETPVWRDFFGKRRAFSSSIQKFADSADARIIAFVSYYENGRYIMKFSALEKEPYSFFEEEILQRPQMWWAADLLALLIPQEEVK